MDKISLFLTYAKEFEHTFKDDDWSRLERFFAADAVYEVLNAPFACRIEGRDAVFAGLRKSISGFDRRMDTRRIEVLSPPHAEGDEFSVGWAVTYTLGDLPPLRLAARTIARYRDDHIVYLSDDYDDASGAEALAWIEMAQTATGETYDFSYV